MEIFTVGLRDRNVEFQVPSDPLVDTSWIHPTALGRQRKAKSSDDPGNGNILVIEERERALRRFGGACLLA